jgi:predicted nucleic acid-binding protein
MNVVDSSGWLEYFGNGSNADFFAPPLADTGALIVPAISILEVFKRVLVQRNEAAALQAAALMQQGRVIPLDEALALSAAKLSVDLKLPMADSIMLATARGFEAVLWTQDADFENLPGVRYVVKNRNQGVRS